MQHDCSRLPPVHRERPQAPWRLFLRRKLARVMFWVSGGVAWLVMTVSDPLGGDRE